mgnify:CR=1 FL=1
MTKWEELNHLCKLNGFCIFFTYHDAEEMYDMGLFYKSPKNNSILDWVNCEPNEKSWYKYCIRHRCENDINVLNPLDFDILTKIREKLSTQILNMLSKVQLTKKIVDKNGFYASDVNLKIGEYKTIDGVKIPIWEEDK